MKKDLSTQPNTETYNPDVAGARLSGWFSDLDKVEIQRLVIYLSELNRFNKTLNLVSALTLKNADSVHVADSVLAARHIVPHLDANEPLYDFGSGNGCPGLIFGAIFPTHRVVLVDRDQRKMEFCKHVIHELGLQNVEILIQDIDKLPVASTKYVVARGFAPFSRALINYRKQLPKGGKFFHMKSDGWANELAALPSQIFSHWAPSVIGKYRIPENSADMFVVLTEKISD